MIDSEKLRAYGQSVRQFLASPYGTAIKFLISIGVVLFFLSRIDIERFSTILEKVDYRFLVVIAGLTLLRNVVSGIRFHHLLTIRQKIPALALIRHYFIANMFNVFLPTSLGGDVVRAVFLSDYGISKKATLFYVLMERYIGMVLLLLMGLLSALFIDLPFYIYLALILFAGGGLLILWLIYSEGIFKTENKNVQQARGFLRQLTLQHKALLQVVFYSLLFHLVCIYSRYLVVEAFDIDIGLLPFIAFFPLISIVNMMPVSIGGIGIRELSYVYFFSLVGIGQEEALIIAFGAYFSIIVGGLSGALVYFYDYIIKGVRVDFRK